MPAARTVGSLGLFAALAVLHTWPLAATPATRVHGSDDVMTGLWSLTEMARRVVTDPAHLMDGNMFYPFQTTLAVLDHQITSALLAAPLMAAGAEGALAYNLMVLTTFALSGFFAYLLARRLTGSTPAGLVAGTAFAFSSYRVLHLTQSHILATMWLPLALLALYSYLEKPTWRRWGMLACSALLVAFSSWHTAILGGLAIGLVALWTMVGDHGPIRRRASGLVLVAILVGVALLPLAMAYTEISRQWPPRTGQGRETMVTLTSLSANVVGLVAPPASSRAPYAPLLSPFESSDPGVFPGLVVVLLALPAVMRLKALRAPPTSLLLKLLRWWLWAGGALVSLAVISAGLGPLGEPIVRVLRPIAPFVVFGLALGALSLVAARRSGHADATTRLVVTYTALAAAGALLALGPQVLVGPVSVGSGLWRFDLLPVTLIIRAPQRLSLLLALGSAVLAAVGTARILAGLRPTTRVVAAVALLVLLNADLAFRSPRFSDVPRPGEADQWLADSVEAGAVVEYPLSYPNHWAVYGSQRYGRRIVNGMGYLFPLEFKSMEELPDLSAEQIALLWEHSHPRFVVVRRDLYEPEVLAQVLAAIERQPEVLRLRAAFDGTDIYELTDRGRGSELYRRWSHAALRDARGLVLEGLVTTGRPDTVGEWVVALNGRTLLEVTGPIAATASAQIVPFEAGDLGPLMNTFEIRADYRFTESADRHAIGTTGVRLAADVVVTADRDRAVVQVNGRVLRPDRGYMLVVLDAATGAIADVGQFNTTWFEDDADALVAFVDAIPAGAPVVVATEFDASRALTAGAVAALGALGLEVDLRGQFQAMHAAIGVKGAPAGSVLEVTGPTTAVVELGLPDTRYVQLRSLQLR